MFYLVFLGTGTVLKTYHVSLQPDNEVHTISMPILGMRTLRFRKVEFPAQCTQIGRSRAGIQTNPEAYTHFG